MKPFSRTDRPAPQINPLRDLTHLAIQTRAAACALPGNHPELPEENVGYVVNGSSSLLQTLHQLARGAVLMEDNPLYDRGIRHDIRNQVAVVKGFTDLMLMEVPEELEVATLLDRITDLCAEFVSILDEARSVASGGTCTSQLRVA